MNIDLDAVIMSIGHMMTSIIDFWGTVSVTVNGHKYTFWAIIIATSAFTVIVDNFTGGVDE